MTGRNPVADDKDNTIGTIDKVVLGAGQFRDPVEFADSLREMGAPIPEGAEAWATSHTTTLDGEEVPMPRPETDIATLRADIDPEALQQMEERGGSWFAYRNEAGDSSQCGHLKFLKCGPGCTYETPPTKLPDGPDGAINWPYQPVSEQPVVG